MCKEKLISTKTNNMNLSEYKLQNEKYEFEEIPEEIRNYFEAIVDAILTPMAKITFLKGNMVIMDWDYKVKFLRDLIK